MSGGKTAFARLVGMCACVLAASWVFLPGGLAAASEDAEDGSGLATACMSGKLTLEFSSSWEDAGGDGMTIGMAFDGRLHLPTGGGTSCDVTAGARPHPAGRGMLGYAAIGIAAKPGRGFRLDFDARRSRTSEANDPDGPRTDRVSSTLRAALAWRTPSGRLAAKGTWEKEDAAHPNRPMSDHERWETSGELRVTPVPWVSALVGLDLIDKQYRLAPHNTSVVRVSSIEVGLKRGKALEGEFRLERKHATYPWSSTKTYSQDTREVALSWDRGSGTALALVISQVDKGFPSASYKNLRDRELAASASIEGTAAGTLTLEATVFERRVPASPEREYRACSVGAEVELSPGERLSLSAGCALSRRLYVDPMARAGDYRQAEVTWKLAYDLLQDLDVTYEAAVRRREYPLKETENTHRFKSGVSVVYRF
ncbi:MAG: hypothetical protein ACM309_05795 [Bacillota bacterium]